MNSEALFSSQQLRVKSALEVWRLKTIDALGYTPDDLNYCCRFNIMHDVFIDRIVQAVPFMRSYDDFYQAAYYWNLLDRYGPEVFQLIREELNAKKRSCADDYSSDGYQNMDHYRSDKRIRQAYY